MSVAIFLVFVLLGIFAVRWFLFWSIPEVADDSSIAEPPEHPSLFYDPRTWAIFQPKLLISYRRDKRGRFRKMP